MVSSKAEPLPQKTDWLWGRKPACREPEAVGVNQSGVNAQPPRQKYGERRQKNVSPQSASSHPSGANGNAERIEEDPYHVEYGDMHKGMGSKWSQRAKKLKGSSDAERVCYYNKNVQAPNPPPGSPNACCGPKIP